MYVPPNVHGFKVAHGKSLDEAANECHEPIKLQGQLSTILVSRPG